MCTLTHFAYAHAPHCDNSSALYPVMLQAHEPSPQSPGRPRFQVVLAGTAFFHIKETSTGHVRGFRADHNEACALARCLESSS
jgi:hypothetical protein